MTDPLSGSTNASLRPLVVDLDGTLCRTDTLWETFFAAWRICWWLPLAAPFWLIVGRTALKSRLAEIALPTISSLPWNESVISAVETARTNGRTCVLATAANERIAHACASELGLFNEVIASGDSVNVKGKTKADLLVLKFGVGGFDYIGDSRADVPVWSMAAKKLSASTLVPPDGECLGATRGESPLGSWTRLLRVRHWVKNVLVLVAPIAAHSWANAAGWQAVALTFIAFCAVCSGVYVLNDLFDLAADRMHPSKSKRPLAAGALPLATAFAVSLILLTGGIAIASMISLWVAAVVLAYVAINAAYTVYLKRVPVVDVFCLAGLYTLRIVAGAAAVMVPLSTWLVAFSVFAFLSLALLKRAADIARLGIDEVLPGRGYSGRDAAFVNGFGLSAAIAACLVLALYVASDQVSSMYAEPLWLWALTVVVLLWLARMWRMAMNATMEDDPVLFATHDGVSWACATAVAACVLLAL